MAWYKTSTWLPDKSVPCPCTGQISPLSTVGVIKQYLEDQGTNETEWSNKGLVRDLYTPRTESKESDEEIEVIMIANHKRKSADKATIKAVDARATIKALDCTMSSSDNEARRKSENSDRLMFDNLAMLCPCVTPVSLEISKTRAKTGKERAYVMESASSLEKRPKSKDVKESDSHITKDLARIFRQDEDNKHVSRYEVNESEFALPTISSDGKTQPLLLDKNNKIFNYVNLEQSTLHDGKSGLSEANKKQTHMLFTTEKRLYNTVNRFNETSSLIRGFRNRYPKARISERLLTNQLNHRKLLRRFYGNKEPVSLNANFSMKRLEKEASSRKQMTTTPIGKELRNRSLRALTSRSEEH